MLEEFVQDYRARDAKEVEALKPYERQHGYRFETRQVGRPRQRDTAEVNVRWLVSDKVISARMQHIAPA